MLLAAAGLGALDLTGAVTPAVLLILLCGIGVGQGLTGPIAQTLQPELVPASERPQAIAPSWSGRPSATARPPSASSCRRWR